LLPVYGCYCGSESNSIIGSSNNGIFEVVLKAFFYKGKFPVLDLHGNWSVGFKPMEDFVVFVDAYYFQFVRNLETSL